MRSIVAIGLSFMVASCAAYDSKVRKVQPSPAYWVDSQEDLAPVWGDFTFDALSFSTPRDGWIVGDRFLLHVVGEDVAVSFTRPTGVWLHSTVFTSEDFGWAAGFRGPLGVVWQYRDGKWQPSDTSTFDWPDWSVLAVWASPEGQAWAASRVSVGGDHEHPPAPKQFKILLLRWDGQEWRIDDSPREGGRRWAFGSACFYPSGDGWFVGTDFGDANALRPLAVLRRHGEWEPVSLPEVANTRMSIGDVICLPGDRAIALGTHAGNDNRPGQPFLLRYRGSWERIEMPIDFQSAEIGAIAALSDSDVWLAVSDDVPYGDQRATFLHWTDGQWSEVPVPQLPGGRVGGYSFTDMQFVSPTEGWAIANDYDGPDLVRGLIFHYKDGVWRNRNWNWHFWNEPWFGLAAY